MQSNIWKISLFQVGGHSSILFVSVQAVSKFDSHDATSFKAVMLLTLSYFSN